MKHWIISLSLMLCALPAAAQLNLFSPERLPDPQRFSVVLELNDVKQAKVWLDMGLDPNFEGHTIGTGLMIGAWEGNIPMMELFLSRGADIHRINRFGETALMLAAWKNRREAMQWLLQRGARPNRADREWTALHYATFSGHADLVDDLLKAGADINARSTNGSTVIMMAAREGHGTLAQRLMAAGANPAIQNDFNEDAVAWAMKQRNYDIAKSMTSAENFAALSRMAADLRKPVRSIPVPDAVEEHMRMARIASAQNRQKDAIEAYRKAIAELKAQEAAAQKAAASKAKTAEAPSGVVIRARREQPEAQSMALTYANTTVPAPSPAPPPETREAAVERLMTQAEEAENSGKRRKALRLYREAAQLLREGGN